MLKRRIIAHLWMWGIIVVGIILDFLLIPKRNVSFLVGSFIQPIILIPLAVFLVYYISSIVYYCWRYSLSGSTLEKLVTAGIYGRRAHPTCSLVAILSWITFIFYPETRVFVADAWITLVVFFWIKMEETIYKKNKKESGLSQDDPD